MRRGLALPNLKRWERTGLGAVVGALIVMAFVTGLVLLCTVLSEDVSHGLSQNGSQRAAIDHGWHNGLVAFMKLIR